LPVQRAMASAGRVVMVGRDIATVVAPDAELKIYLDASPEERARRRHVEIGSNRSYDDVLADLIRRDAADSSRETAPMTKAADAIVIETDGRGVEEIVAELVQLTEAVWLNMTANGED
jgi:CMP/dCMP kinase